MTVATAIACGPRSSAGYREWTFALFGEPTLEFTYSIPTTSEIGRSLRPGRHLFVEYVGGPYDYYRPAAPAFKDDALLAMRALHRLGRALHGDVPGAEFLERVGAGLHEWAGM